MANILTPYPPDLPEVDLPIIQAQVLGGSVEGNENFVTSGPMSKRTTLETSEKIVTRAMNQLDKDAQNVLAATDGFDTRFSKVIGNEAGKDSETYDEIRAEDGNLINAIKKLKKRPSTDISNNEILSNLGEENDQLTYKGHTVGSNVGLNGQTNLMKSNISAGDLVTISKPRDTSYASAIISIWEYIQDGANLTEIGRSYDNGAKDSFEPNEYIDFSDGLSLANRKVVSMETVRAMDENTLYKTSIDLTEYQSLEVV
jgi:hypothetical protein